MTRTASNKAGDGEGYALLVIEPLRAIRTALDTMESISITDLAKSYRHVNPSDYHRIKLHEGVATDEEATLWLLRHAAKLLSEWIEVAAEAIRLKPGCKASDLRWQDRMIHPNVEHISHLKSPFDPMLESGTFAKNIRAPGRDDMTALRESMETFGWIPHHPAIIDDKGIVLVGHRRLTVAKELGIIPREGHELVRLPCGSGDAADAKRLSLALASNLGNKPLNAADRKRIAERLYGEEAWSQQRIADLLKVSQWTIKEDTKHLEAPLNKRTEKRGRPKQNLAQSEPTQRALGAIRQTVNATGARPTRNDLEKAGVSAIIAERALTTHQITEPIGDPLRAWWLKMIADSPVPLTRERIELLIAEFRMFDGRHDPHG